MKLKMIIFALQGILISGYTQSLSPKVIATSGAYYQNAQCSLSQTVGEMSMVKTFFNNVILTQGFQQTVKVVTATKETSSGNITMELYPVPADDNLNIKIHSKKSFEVVLCLESINGQWIEDLKRVWIQEGDNTIQIKTQQWPSGRYIIRLKNELEKTLFNHSMTCIIVH